VVDGQESARKPRTGPADGWCCLLAHPLACLIRARESCTSPAAQLILGTMYAAARWRAAQGPRHLPGRADLYPGGGSPQAQEILEAKETKSLATKSGGRDLSVISCRIWGPVEPLERQSSPAQVPLPSRSARPCGNLELTLPRLPYKESQQLGGKDQAPLRHRYRTSQKRGGGHYLFACACPPAVSIPISLQSLQQSWLTLFVSLYLICRECHLVLFKRTDIGQISWIGVPNPTLSARACRSLLGFNRPKAWK